MTFTAANSAIEFFLSRLSNKKHSGNGWTARCPAHEDVRNSLSIGIGDDGRILLKCHAGCTVEQIVSGLGLKMRDLFQDSLSSQTQAGTAHPHTSAQEPEYRSENAMTGGLDLCEYAESKGLPEEFLKSLGITDQKYQKKMALRIPYLDSEGREIAARYRISMNGNDKFRWRKGDKLCLYGLWRIEDCWDYVLIVEGESDCQTCWYHGIPAIGLPGANNWNEARDAPHLNHFSAIYVVREPDKGGEAVENWLQKSSIKNRVFILNLEGHKDPSSLYLADRERFVENIRRAMASSVPWTDIENLRLERNRNRSRGECSGIARKPFILDEFVRLLPSCGLAGETKAAKILFLSLITRMFERPTSMVVDGPSAAGKSHLIETVLKFFPKSTYHDLTAMSEKNLAYTEQDLKHRFIILYEAAGLSGGFATYLIRSLLSEGRIRYEFVEKTRDGLRSRLIEKEGPTGLIMTTTSTWLHPENATRLITVTISDSKDQTSKVLLSLADQERDHVDFAPWHALQEYIQDGTREIYIPYAEQLARMTKPLAVRLRRDFGAVLSLIKGHALLHQATREVDSRGRILAKFSDYAVVLGLVGQQIAQVVDAGVPKTVKKTVQSVAEAIEESDVEYATIRKIAEKLNIDRSSATRRVSTAIIRGYLRDLQDKKGKEKQIILGDPLPADLDIFPTRKQLEEACADFQGAQTSEEAHTTQKIEEIHKDADGVCSCAPKIKETNEDRLDFLDKEWGVV
jgi:hypothetical protein